MTATLSHLPEDVAGIRLSGLADLRPMLAFEGPVGSIASQLIGSGAFAVRAVLFDKTAAANWGLAWHQDRTVVVRERHDTPGYGPWSVKAGLTHVAPPFRILSSMATLRVHLDDVDADNAPLLIAPGSHLEGPLAEHSIPEVVERLGTSVCLADAGDIWAYATPILHASRPAVRPGRRRVLQVDYACDPLDGHLEWLGV
ncbi:MAG: phytanoyl-CoA dioxygenase family protein [Brevundimonas sp.]|uniref:phytanoyl-CoA dioxygenase family protein n=1 Tax=Brevundimonas sp. TaxID=1871086 RepID=UPI0027327A8D|nr:phytanoyl-CoA dioxygenase family protein [Brevundimonas sp.]MDP3406561.1 phytanoyl-CoA dioxygenase family protein [Brevundimonas sp.]